MKSLQELAQATVDIDAAAKQLCLPVPGETIAQKIERDIEYRRLLKAGVKAQDEYNAALDAEAERRLSESTVVGIAAE